MVMLQSNCGGFAMKNIRVRGLFVGLLALLMLGAACSQTADSGQGGGGNSSSDGPKVASDIGVTADTITVAYLDPDIKKLVDAGFVGDEFTGPEALNGLVDAVNSDGGINGRKLELRRYLFDVMKVPAGLINACTKATEDDPNFIALSMAFFGDGATCIALDHKMPLLTSSGMAGQLYDPASENMFLYNLTFEENQAALVKALTKNGSLKGKKLGAVIRDEPGGRESVEASLRKALAAAGYPNLDVATITSSMGDPASLSAAAQKFKADGVDGVFLLANVYIAGGFMAAAEKEGLKATYYTSDQSEVASNLISKFGPPSVLKGAEGVTWKRLKGSSTSPVDKECVSRSPAAADLVPGTERYNGFASLCLMFDTMVKALRNAGNNPTRASFVSAMEQLGDFPMGSGAKGSFGPNKHTAPDEVRAVKFDLGCNCWVADGDFVSLR